MIYSTGTISINGNTATGSGTNWTAPASHVRAGQTIIVMSNPVQMFQISSVNSATSMTVTPAASPALSGQNYGILVSDNISVDGLAQAMSQLIKEYDENIGAWETFATTSANQNITVTINGTSLSIPALGKLLQKGSNGALPVNQGGTGATNAADARTNLGLADTSGYVGRLVNVRVFTSSGTYTPRDGTKSIIVEVQGGGGGGGNAQATSATTYTLTSSGGAGGYAKSRLTNLADSYSVTVGAGGAGGVSGGQSVFDSITCSGGGGGSQIGGAYTASSSVVTLGAAGGGAAGGNIANVPGSGAAPSLLISGGAVSATGGNSVIGTGGRGAGASASGGVAGTFGGGGGGANASLTTTLIAGGKGGDGVVIIWEFA